MTPEQIIADEIRRHDPAEGWRRESYCSCGALTEPYGEGFIDHLAASIMAVIGKTPTIVMTVSASALPPYEIVP